MQIYLKTLHGKSTPLVVEPTLQIVQVKNLFYEKEKIPAQEQLLIFGGKELQDSLTLEECEIYDNYSIFVVRKKKTVDHFKELSNIFPLISDASTEQVFYEVFINNIDIADFEDHEYYKETRSILDRIKNNVGVPFIEPGSDTINPNQFSDPIQGLEIQEKDLLYLKGPAPKFKLLDEVKQKIVAVNNSVDTTWQNLTQMFVNTLEKIKDTLDGTRNENIQLQILKLLLEIVFSKITKLKCAPALQTLMGENQKLFNAQRKLLEESMGIYKEHIAENNFDNKAKKLLEGQIAKFHEVLELNSKKTSALIENLNNNEQFSNVESQKQSAMEHASVIRDEKTEDNQKCSHDLQVLQNNKDKFYSEFYDLRGKLQDESKSLKGQIGELEMKAKRNHALLIAICINEYERVVEMNEKCSKVEILNKKIEKVDKIREEKETTIEIRSKKLMEKKQDNDKCIEAANLFEGSSNLMLNSVQEITDTRLEEHLEQSIQVNLERFEIFASFWLLVAEQKHGLERAITIAKQKLVEYDTKIKKASRMRFSSKVENLHTKSTTLETGLNDMEKECKQYDELIAKLDADFDVISKNLAEYGQEIVEDEVKVLYVNNLEGNAIKISHPRKEFELRCLEDDCNELEEEIEDIEEKHKYKNEQLKSIKSCLQSLNIPNPLAASAEFEKVEMN
jgi:large subunit ribosomal protein L40e